MMKSVLIKFCLFFLIFNIVHAERYITTSTTGPTYFGAWVYKGHQNIVYWSSANVDWYLNENGAGDGFTYNQTQSFISNAYSAWANVTSSDITFDYQGSTDRTNANDGYNVHFWDEDGSVFTGVLAGASAVTILTRNANYELLDVDIGYNGASTWYDNTNNWTDIQSVAIHEIGHSIGLGHTEVETTPVPVMTYSADPSSNRRILKTDDVDGASFLYGGNIVVDDTLSGTDYYNWDLTVASGRTLTIDANSSLNFENSSSLSINGHLQVNGTSNDHVIFDFGSPNSGTQNGVKINSGGTVTATYTDIQNAYRGIYFNESYGTVNYCTFEDCSTGLYLYRTNYAAQQPNFNYNTVFKNTYDGNNTGVYCSYSSPYMTNNEVYNYYTGVGVIYNSSPSLGYSSAEGKNNLHDNYKNLHAINSSNPFLGSTSYQGKNKLEDALNLNILAQTNCNITAEQNWWGSDDEQTIASTISTSTSSVDFIPFLDSSPFRVIGPPEEHVALSKSSQGVEELFKAQEYIVGKEYEKSLEIIRVKPQMKKEFPKFN